MTSESALQLNLKTRYVSDFGETLVVRDHFGTKVLTDPIDEFLAVVVPTGRRAKLICLTFGEPARFCERDAHVIVTNSGRGLGFASVRYPELCVFLQDLPDGQRVDVLPTVEPAVAYAAILRPMPVLYGAIAVQPLYATA
jgi:hypothetical protein